MSNVALIGTEIIDEGKSYDFRELCDNVSINPDLVISLVNYGVVSPIVECPDYQWSFHAASLSRLQLAHRLLRDFEINASGVAILLDLIEENRKLHKKVSQMEQLIFQLTETG